MMKRSTDPRRVYVRKSITHLCFAGKLYGAKASLIDAAQPVLVEPLKSDGGKSRIQVVQGERKEVWRTTKF